MSEPTHITKSQNFDSALRRFHTHSLCMSHHDHHRTTPEHPRHAGRSAYLSPALPPPSVRCRPFLERVFIRLCAALDAFHPFPTLHSNSMRTYRKWEGDIPTKFGDRLSRSNRRS